MTALPTSELPELTERLRHSTHRVWGYIRVSSDKQEDGQSPEVQEQEIRAYAAAKGLGIPEFVVESASAEHPAIPVSFSVAGVPAEKAESPRPLFLMLLGFLSDLKDGGHLIVWKLDRFARLGYEQELILSILWRKNITVHSSFKGEQDILNRDKSSDPVSAMFRQILGAVAQYERALIKIRTQTGYKMKASKGEWVGGGLPYGYLVKGNDLVINATEDHWVRVIFYLHHICDEGPTRIGHILAKKFHQTGWYRQRVSRIVDNEPLYLGCYVDPYDVPHARPDLRILPTDWDQWAEANQLTPSSCMLTVEKAT